MVESETEEQRSKYIKNQANDDTEILRISVFQMSQ